MFSDSIPRPTVVPINIALWNFDPINKESMQNPGREYEIVLISSHAVHVFTLKVGSMLRAVRTGLVDADVQKEGQLRRAHLRLGHPRVFRSLAPEQ